MAVHLSGAVLASLFYDNAENDGDQIGFLLGEVVNHVTDTISDSQIQNSQVETRIYIYGNVPCPRDQRVHNSRMQIIESQVLALLKQKHKNIVGWYSFRRNSTMRPSYRERLLHQSLASTVSDEPLEDFLMLLCTCKPTSNLSTHSFDHGFLKLANSGFKKVTMKVINLGDTTHTEYQLHRSHTVSQSQGTYSQIMRDQEHEFLDSRGQVEVKKVNMLSATLDQQLQGLSDRVVDSESRLSELEEEVQALRKRLQLREAEKQTANVKGQPPSNHPEARDDYDAVRNDFGSTKAKQPSVDDLLSMEFIDDNPDERAKGQNSSAADVMAGSASVNHETLRVDIESHVKHKDTSKLNDSATTNDLEQHSRTVETDSVHGNPTSSHVTAETEQKQKSAKSDDPFSFVSTMIAKSKEDPTTKDGNSFKSTMEVPQGEQVRLPGSVSLSAPRDLRKKAEPGSSRDFKEMKKQRSNREAATALATAAVLAGSKVKSERTRGQRVQGRQGQGNFERSDSQDDQSGDNSANDDERKTSRSGKVRGPASVNRCGQEVSKTKFEKCKSDSADDDPTSTESGSFEEMDISASPVY